MSIAGKTTLVLSAAASIVLVASACADSTRAADDADPDASASLPPGPDAEPAPPADASPDVRPDAAPRTCSDDGFCHTVLPDNQTLQAVWADGAGIAWAGTKFGAILRFDGTEWKVHASGLGEIDAIWGSGPTDVWAAGAKGVYRGTGATSATVAFTNTPLEPDAEVHITSVWGGSADDVWAVGARTDGAIPSGRVYHFTGTKSDGLPVWELDPLSFDDTLAYDRVWGSPGSGVWIGVVRPFGEWGATEQHVVRRPASSTSFDNVELPEIPDPWNPDAPFGELLGAAIESDSSVWLALKSVWSQRAIYHGSSSDGGQTFAWTVMPYHVDDVLEFTSLAASPSNVWAAGHYGRLATWDGSTFVQASIEVRPLPVIDPLFDVWAAPGGEVWAVGKGIALHRAKK